MLYELMGIVRSTTRASTGIDVREVLYETGKLIVNNRGVIRNISLVGLEQISTVIQKDQKNHYRGFRFVLLFDASSAVQSEIMRALKRDPKVLRTSVIRINTQKNLDIATSIDRVKGYKSILDKTRLLNNV